MFIAVGLFILIFGITFFLGWRQFETTRHNALNADKTTVNLLADLILEHNKATIGILQSYAYRSLFIDAVKSKDLAGTCRHLSDLKKNTEIDLIFVTDKRGILWANFPVFPEAIGKDLSSRDWYKEVSSHWKPYISTVFKLIVGDKPLAAAVCVPIFDEKERVIGILASSQRLGFLVDAIERVPFSPYTTVNVIDRVGHILYSNKFPYQENITDYQFFPVIEPALKEKKQQIEINDPQKDQEKSYLTVVPVGDIGWTVIIERSLRDIYRSDLRRFIEIGAISFLLFLLIIFFLVYLRKATLFKKTGELLQAETKLQRGEEALQESDEKYRSLAASVDSMYLVDKDCTYLFMNEGCRMRLGQPLEVIIGRRYGEFHSQESARKFADCIREVFETGKSSTKEHRSERDGRYFLRTFTPIRGRSPVEEISKVVIVSKDIADCKQVENDLIETVRQLQETRDMLIQFEKEAAVGRLAAGVAHELLNPTSIISSRLQFMEETLTDQARESVRICREQLQRIAKISHDLHQSSAIQPRPLVSGDLRDVIELSLKMTESRIREDQVCVVYHPLPAIIPVKMETDRMSKVMVHLILNACDALLNNDQKLLIITIQYPIAADKPSSVLLIVADNGCGVSEGYINRIFDPFFTTKDPGKGTGLGLSICKKIIWEHGGTIHVEKNDLGGVSFIVELPLDHP